MEHFKKVSTKRKEAHFFASRKKSEFFSPKMNVLGHVVDDDGLHVSPEKITRIGEWTTPKDRKKLRVFLELVNYISQFLPHIATITALLTDLTGNAEFVWTPTHDTAFENTTRLADDDNVVIRPINHESGVPIWLITDASDTRVGAWVGQGETPETARPASLHSRKFTNTQMNYGTTDKEALAIMDAWVAFDHLLAGYEFTIVTDHQPLMYLRRDRRPSRKQMRWRTHLAKYMAKIVYKSGAINYLADALSHLYRHDTGPAECAQDPTEETEDLEATNTHKNSPHTLFAASFFSDTMSRFEPLRTLGDHSECGSDCSMREGNDWEDMVSSGHLSEEELNHSAIHWTACHKAVCEFRNENRLAGQVIIPESPEVATMRARYLAEGNKSPRLRIDLNRVRK